MVVRKEDTRKKEKAAGEDEGHHGLVDLVSRTENISRQGLSS